MRTVNFVFGLHNHQPVGNFESIFESSFQTAYSPFIDVLEKHPKIRMSLHYTGVLLEWLSKHKPAFVKRLKKLVQRGQVEFQTGGFYEPILPIIPDHDKVAQIRKLTEFVKRQVGYKARGMWLAERVWEPHLARCLNEAGVEYTVLDDSHFKCTGLSEEETFGYFTTEELGRPLQVFPISEKLRYTIPFQPPQATIDYLKSVATDDGTRIVVMADDGEKFGVWPDTHKHVYEERWLEDFFKALEDNSDWIKIITFSEAIDTVAPLGKVYLPTASYMEMMEWAMPPA
ncbi:MAG: alpha-amylase, partial [bacterium]